MTQERLDPILRENEVLSDEKPPIYYHSCFTYFPKASIVIVDDGERVLNPQQNKLLGFLTAQPERFFSREELIAKIWPEDKPYSPKKALRFIINELRKKIEPAYGMGREIIKNTHGAGYRLENPKSKKTRSVAKNVNLQDQVLSDEKPAIYHHPQFDYFEMKREVRFKDGKKCRLSEQENKLLAALSKAPNELHSYHELMLEIWVNPDYYSIQNLKQVVRQLRDKLEPNPRNRRPEIIKNRYKQGYLLKDPQKPPFSSTTKKTSRLKLTKLI